MVLDVTQFQARIQMAKIIRIQVAEVTGIVMFLAAIDSNRSQYLFGTCGLSEFLQIGVQVVEEMFWNYLR